MNNENETTEEVCKELRAGNMVWLANRIHAAHKRELAAKNAEIVAKDDKILELHSHYQHSITKLRKDIGECAEEIAKRDALIKELADALEMEIVCYEDCDNIKVCANVKRCDSREYRALVAKARKVAK